MQQVKLNCILTLCFWCNQIYSNDTVSIIDVLDSLQGQDSAFRVHYVNMVSVQPMY